MPWQVDRNEELDLIESVYTGPFTMKDVRDATAKALSLAIGNGPHLFLSDISGAHSELSVMDIYALPDQWEAAQSNRSNKLAVVVSGESLNPGDLQFYENVCKNRGWNVRVFEVRQAAVEWLIKR